WSCPHDTGAGIPLASIPGPNSSQRPSSRAKNPFVGATSAWPGQRSASGTPARACSMCWPQPAQVGFPQVRQVTARHMSGAPLGGVGPGLGPGLLGLPSLPPAVAALQLDDVVAGAAQGGGGDGVAQPGLAEGHDRPLLRGGELLLMEQHLAGGELLRAGHGAACVLV